jgi:putative adenylate-forming enzyme
VPRLAGSLSVAGHFAAARLADRRHGRAALLAAQRRALDAFLAGVLPRAPFYARFRGAPLADLPVVDKARVMGEFAAFNTRGIGWDDALAVALQAERTRDFSPSLGDVTVGLSSGTSGNRGLFLVSGAERRRWAGTILARTLTAPMLRRIASPWAPPLRAAFFLRANSNLYGSVASRRVRLDYFDLLHPFAEHVARLRSARPHLLIAPAGVLRMLADEQLAGRLAIAPERVVSVAEVLDEDDAAAIARAFGRPVHQIYQCTEGFLGYTCERAALHLNERQVHVEPEWLDAERIRFTPVVTDFTRRTQIFARYRLDDVLHAAPPCACGRPERTIARIEGRLDDVLRLSGADGVPRPVFADFVRRAMMFCGERVRDYRVRQNGPALEIALDAPDERAANAAVAFELARLWDELAVRPPRLTFVPWRAEPAGTKRRRVAVVTAPAG